MNEMRHLTRGRGYYQRAKEKFEKLLKDSEKVLHPWHELKFNTYAQLINCCDTCEDLKAAIK